MTTMHSPSSQWFPPSSLQKWKHSPQCSQSCCVLTQTPPQSSSPGFVHSPPVVVCVVSVPVPSVVPLVVLVDDESLPDEVDVVSEVEVDVDVDVDVDDEVISEVVGVDVSEVVGEAVTSDVDVVDTLFVLDIESVPTSDVLIDPLVIIAVVSAAGSSPLQATLRPTSAASTTGADPWV